MKSKLGVIFTLMCVMSFFLYRIGENNRVEHIENNKEELICGIVVNAETNEPIYGVSIAISGNSPKSRSNEDGEFMVHGYLTDSYLFKHPDYKSLVVEGKDLNLVKLKPNDK